MGSLLDLGQYWMGNTLLKTSLNEVDSYPSLRYKSHYGFKLALHCLRIVGRDYLKRSASGRIDALK